MEQMSIRVALLCALIVVVLLGRQKSDHRRTDAQP